MLTIGVARRLLYGGNHVGWVRLCMDQEAHQICPRRIPLLAIMWEESGVVLHHGAGWMRLTRRRLCMTQP